MSWVARSSTRRVLSICLAVVGAVLLLQLVGPRPGYRGQVMPQPAAVGSNPGTEIATETYQLGPLADYEVIRNRPLFNSDRRPAPPAGELEMPVEQEVAVEAPIEPVNVTLAGVIITPDRRMALVRDNLTGRTHRLYEGMPLQGQQAAWTLSEIGPRSIGFSAAGAEQVTKVELDVNKAALPPGQAAINPAGAAQRDASGQEDARTAAQSRAEEIRRRIEERRAQMRAEAQRAAEGAKETE